MTALASVLLTGAGGAIGRVLRPSLRAFAGEVRLLDREPLDAGAGETAIAGDVRDAETVARAAAGVEAIVHLAGIPDEASFDAILEHNVIGTQRVFEAARSERVRRVVYASSNHVVGFYPRSVTVGTEHPVRPDSNYGVAKVFGEALGRLYHDKWGIEVVCLRIGSFRERPHGVRQQSTWLSHGDAIRLFERSLLAPEVGFVVAYGVSANATTWWRNDGAAAALGYRPQDDAAAYAGDGDAQSERGEAALRQGGAFVLPDYMGGMT